MLTTAGVIREGGGPGEMQIPRAQVGGQDRSAHLLHWDQPSRTRDRVSVILPIPSLYFITIGDSCPLSIRKPSSILVAQPGSAAAFGHGFHTLKKPLTLTLSAL